MEEDSGRQDSSNDGFKMYYKTKIDELLLAIQEKQLNIKRLQSQRNELNTKGI